MTYRKLIVFVIVIFSLSSLLYFKLIQKNFRKENNTSSINLTPLPSPNLEISSFTLNNGLKTVIYKNTASPKVLIQIVYRTGAAQEVYGERGIAHAIEHMVLYKGSKKLTESDVSAISRKFGAHINAFTSHDITSYFFETTKNNWEVFLDILAESMHNAQFNKQAFSSEIKTIFQELQTSIDTEKKIIFRKMFSLLFPGNHPYHHPVIGYKDDLFALTPEKLFTFYKKYYHPNNATLFIIGDVNLDEVKQKVTQYFENIPAKENIQYNQIPLNENPLQTTNSKMFSRSKQQSLYLFWRVPLKNPKNSLLLTLSSILLGQGPLSRLYKNLIDQHHVASSVTSSTVKMKHEGVIFIRINPLPGKLLACKTLAQQELTKIINKGFTDEELHIANNIKRMNVFMRHESIKNLAYRWIRSYAATGDVNRYFTELNDYATVTSKDLQLFIKDHLNPFIASSIHTTPFPPHLRKKHQTNQKSDTKLDKKRLAKFKRTEPVPPPAYAHKTPSPQKIDFIPPSPDTITTLPNGLTVIIKQQLDAPLLQVHCRLNNAHYISKTIEGEEVGLMMKIAQEQSTHYSKQQNLRFFRTQGATASFNKTGATLATLTDNHADNLKRLLHILQHPTFPLSAIKRHKKIYHNQVNRRSNNVKHNAQFLFTQSLFPNHPYGWTKQDALTIIEKLGQQDFINLHKQYIAPNNMTIAIVGKCNPQDVLALIEQTTKDWAQTSSTVLPKDAKPNYAKVEKHFTYQSNQNVLMMGSPSFISYDNNDYLPLQLLSHIAFRSFGSRLYSLRDSKGLFYSAQGSWARSTLTLPGYNVVKTITSPENIEMVKQSFKDMLLSIKQEGVTDDELTAAKQWYARSIIKKYSGAARIARTFCLLSTTKLGFNYYRDTLQKLHTLTVSEINKIAKKHFLLEELSILTFGRAK